MFDTIEKLKQEFTDKYVVVDASVPELTRFEGHVGQVKTVNMSGRALVQFDAWSNIGWYDIEPQHLKVVPKPEAPPPGKKQAPPKAVKPAAAKPEAAAGGKKLSPLEMARMQGAAKGGGTTPSTGKKSAPAPSAANKSTADILAAARAGKTAAAGPAAKSKSSTADILAAARGGKSPAASSAPETEEPAAAETTASTADTQPESAAKAPAASGPAFPPGQRPSVPEILDWCRKHDAQ